MRATTIKWCGSIRLVDRAAQTFVLECWNANPLAKLRWRHDSRASLSRYRCFMILSGYSIDTDLSRIDLDKVHDWLSTDAFWAIGRSRDTVQRAARASLNFGAFDNDNELVGYARVITDYVTFAWVSDVYVARSSRGKGIGRLLTQTVVDTLRPFALNRILLSTLDGHALYEKAGFTELPDPDRLMVLRAEQPVSETAA